MICTTNTWLTVSCKLVETEPIINEAKQEHDNVQWEVSQIKLHTAGGKGRRAEEEEEEE